MESGLKNRQTLSFKYRDKISSIESYNICHDKYWKKDISLTDKSLITFRLNGNRIKDLSNSKAEEINKKIL